MRINNSKTDYWVFIWMLALCVISFVLSIKETIEDKFNGISNDCSPIELIRQSKSQTNKTTKINYNDNSLRIINDNSTNNSNSENFTLPDTPKIKEYDNERKKSVKSNYSLTKNVFLNYNNPINRGVSPNRLHVNHANLEYSFSPNKRIKNLVFEGSFEEDDEKMKKNMLNK